MLCYLKIIDGPARGAQLLLGKNQRVLIGRISTADFPIAGDQHLSRSHLVVEGLGDSFRVTDAGSSNGTYVNNTLVSSVLLCTGDIIRAGKSLFQVQLKRESESVEHDLSNQSESAEAADIPNRTISTDFGTERPTEFYIRQSSLPAAAQSVYRETGSVSGGDDTTLCTPLDDSHGFLLMNRHFSVEDASTVLWKQKTPPTAELQMNILRSFGKLPLNVSLIVNRRQIDAAAMTLIQFQLNPSEMTNLTETLCLVCTKRESVLSAMFKACLGRDAMIMVGSRQALSPKWIEQSLDAISYPSLLLSVVQESSSIARGLTKGVEFLLFEVSPHGPFCLLPSNELRDKLQLFNLANH